MGLFYKDLKTLYPAREIKFGFVGFRELSENDSEVRIETQDFIGQFEKFKNYVRSLSIEEKDSIGFGDFAGGLEQVSKLNWTGGKRFVFLLTSTNPYGEMYHDQSDSDTFPQGDPLGRNIEELMRVLRYQKIRVLFLRTKRETFKALGILKQAYENKLYSIKQENLYDIINEEES